VGRAGVVRCGRLGTSSERSAARRPLLEVGEAIVDKAMTGPIRQFVNYTPAMSVHIMFWRLLIFTGVHAKRQVIDYQA
jgi:hypothetical protein